MSNRKLLISLVIIAIVAVIILNRNSNSKDFEKFTTSSELQTESPKIKQNDLSGNPEKELLLETKLKSQIVESKNDKPDLEKVEMNKKILPEALTNIVWELNKSDCELPVKESKWRHDYDYNCELGRSKNGELDITSKQSFINDKLVMYREYVNGVNEPVNFNNEQEDTKMIQFLFEDYAFMAIMLDSKMLATGLQFDLESFKASLKYNDVHRTKSFRARFNNLLDSVGKTMNMLGSQCQKLNWEKACDIVEEFKSYDLRSIAKHELGLNSL